ncbi:MAG: replication-associated protein [Cressdnaviricota sp.]|nr:MAG: replication-associated protein [Cressdnaviricota sp.]
MEQALNLAVDKIYKDFVKIRVLQKKFTDEFNHLDDTTHFVSNKQVSQSNCSSLGIVVYGNSSFYSVHPLENKNKHLPWLVNDQDFYRFLFLSVFEHFGKVPAQIVFGHEHGTNNQKCHLQICVTFSEPFRGTFRPCLVDFARITEDPLNELPNDFSLLFMAQKARNANALKNYCMKDGQFFYLYPDKAIQIVRKKDKQGNEKVDAFATVVKNRDLMTQEQAQDLILTHDPRTGITMFKNVEYALQKMLKDDAPPFEWRFPEHLKGKYPLVEKWYEDYCITDLPRRKALLLYSKERCLGKTTFATSLVNHEKYVAVFRNTFTNPLPGQEPKLLVLDDMAPYNTDNKETWKALVASEPTAIRAAYTNFRWEYRVPCIITTNNLFLLKQLLFSSDFKHQICFQEITEYMGPPDTQPKGMTTIQASISDETMFMLQKMQNESDEKFLAKKRLQDK